MDPAASPPQTPDDEKLILDEEPAQHVPGSFLDALPQFFVFPLILVGTLTLAWLGLRMMVGTGPTDVRTAMAEIRGAAGPHARWQAMYGLADGLARGRFTLETVPASELAALYAQTVRASTEDPAVREQIALEQQYLLSVFQYKRDPELLPLLLSALQAEHPAVRLAALASLGVGDYAEARPALAPFLKAATRDERLLALAGLARLAVAGDDEARELVAGCLAGPDALLHRNAVLALGAVGDERAGRWLPALLDRENYATDSSLDPPDAALSDPDSLRHRREEVIENFLVGACAAAGALGNAALAEPLQRLRATDPSIKVRSAAIDALHRLGIAQETT